MGHNFTNEERARGAKIRNERMNAYERSQRASHAIYRRWYRINAPDEQRVDRALQILSGIVGDGMAHADYELAMKALQIMLGYERMKIALNKGLITTSATPATAEQVAEEEKNVQRLLDTAKRRQAKMMPEIEIKPTADKT